MWQRQLMQGLLVYFLLTDPHRQATAIIFFKINSNRLLDKFTHSRQQRPLTTILKAQHQANL